MSDPASPSGGLRDVARLAWPAIFSYVLNNAYRINDQFWIQGLGEPAQAAVGATFFVQILLFAAMFLAVGGTLALVSRATGAGDATERAGVIQDALLFGGGLGAGLALVVLPLVPAIVASLGLGAEAADLAGQYLSTLYRFLPALALFPVLDAVFIGLGNTRVPMFLQLCAVALNYVLNPMLIYGPQAAQEVHAPGAALLGALAAALGIEGRGIAGAALATGIARVTTTLAALVILRVTYRVRPAARRAPRLERLRAIASISAPASASIAVYAAAYFLLLALVLSRLGDAVTAGLGIGFQVFEGVSFPCYLGVSIAGSSLVGRAIGARDRAGAWRAVASARTFTRLFGVAFALAFFFGGPYVVAGFTDDPRVAAETLGYVRILAFSQYWVAVETANEKVLLGSGRTAPILWISPLGNLLRVPIGAALALGLGWGAAGVWWAINVTTGLKAWLYWRRVQSGTWLEEALARPGDEASG